MDHSSTDISKITGVVALKSAKSFLFLFPANFDPASEIAWISQAFAEMFYQDCKQLKQYLIKEKIAEPTESDLTKLVERVIVTWNKQNSYYELSATPNIATREIDIQLRGANLAIGTIGFRDDLFNLHQQHGVLSARHSINDRSKIKQYVRDSHGVLVPRFVYRAIKTISKISEMTDSEVKQLTAGGDFADGAVLDTKSGRVGIMKKATDIISEHVGGKKPSAFISYTTIASGATNPQGQKFGNVYLMVDLAVVQQTQGWQFYFLGCRDRPNRFSTNTAESSRLK
jgi:hypothetical protein